MFFFNFLLIKGRLNILVFIDFFLKITSQHIFVFNLTPHPLYFLIMPNPLSDTTTDFLSFAISSIYLNQLIFIIMNFLYLFVFFSLGSLNFLIWTKSINIYDHNFLKLRYWFQFKNVFFIFAILIL